MPPIIYYAPQNMADLIETFQPRVNFSVPLLFVFRVENNYIWHIIPAAVFCLPEVIHITKD